MIVGIVIGVLIICWLRAELKNEANFRQSSSLSELGAESSHSAKQNTADKSELLPTQLPKDE